MALDLLGRFLVRSGQYAEADRLLREALAVSRSIANRWSEGRAMYGLGQLLDALGRFDEAIQHLDEALRIEREVDYTRGMGESYVALSSASRHVKDWDAAERFATQAIDATEVIADKALAYVQLGHAQLALSAYDNAKQAFSTSLEIREAHQQPHLTVEPLAGLAALDQRRGAVHRAAERACIAVSRWSPATAAGSAEPIWTCLACREALEASGDLEGAAQALEHARAALDERVNSIDGEAARNTFLQSKREHQALLALEHD